MRVKQLKSQISSIRSKIRGLMNSQGKYAVGLAGLYTRHEALLRSKADLVTRFAVLHGKAPPRKSSTTVDSGVSIVSWTTISAPPVRRLRRIRHPGLIVGWLYGPGRWTRGP